MHFIKLYSKFIMTFLKMKIEYRFGFAVELFANFTLFIVYFVGIKIIFNNFSEIGGWNYYQVLFLFSISWVSYSIAGFLLWQPMLDMGRLIQTGELDIYMIRPISPLKYLVFKQFQYTFIARLVMGVAFLMISFQKVVNHIHLYNLMLLVVYLILGIIIHSSILICIGASAFWILSNYEFGNILTNSDYGLRTFTEYPLNIYPKIIQIILTFIIPYSFVNYFPAKDFINNDGSILGIVATLMVTIISIFIARYLWNTGLKKYESAGN